jgi:KDO2-lipid IV(A) lauroyltransferase
LALKKTWLQIRTEYALAFTLVQLMERLPLSIAGRVAWGTARLLDLALPKLRRVAATNLSFAFPELSAQEKRRLIDGTFRSVGRLLLAIARAPRINSSNAGEWISYDGLEHYQAAKRAGKGILVATAHLGNWELSAYTHALMTESMSVMVRPLDNPLIDAMVERRRSLSGNDLIYKKDAARSVLKALKANQAVGILMDQNASSSEGVFVEFFGRKACASAAFVKFAHHSGAKVIPGFAFWMEAERRYVLRFYPEIPMSGDVVEDTQRIHSFLEQVIRQYPDQWMWIHRRWKTRPEGEPSIY